MYDSPSMATTFTRRVASAADDGSVNTTGFPNLLQTNAFYFGYYTGENDYIYPAFTRFTSVTVPPGASITSSKITVTGNNTIFGTSGGLFTIAGNAVDNAVAPTTVGQCNVLALTSPEVGFGLPALGNDQETDISDIKSIVQTIVNRPGWVSGNAMQFVMHADTSNYYTQTLDAYDYAQSTTKAALLTINYSTGASPNGLSIAGD